MSKSLQEQLLKMGLGDAKKAKTINKQKHKERVQAGKKGLSASEASTLAEQTRLEQVERDRQLNLAKQQEAEQKAKLAQIKQLIDQSRIDGKGDVGFNFTDGATIKKLHVTPVIQQQLIKGQLAIVRQGEDYALVPKLAAEKIQTRSASYVVLLNTQAEQQQEEDDPYADYQIPDDLMW